MKIINGFLRSFILLFVFACTALSARAADSVELRAKYESIRQHLASNIYGAPLYIESSESGDSMQGDVYGIIDNEFSLLRSVLCSAPDWCQLAELHMNIKAATHEATATNACVTLYAGRKHYQPPSKARKLVYDFATEDSRKDYVWMEMFCEKGPHGTRNHRLSFEAIPLEDGKSFMHMRYQLDYGFAANAALVGYLGTLGRKRVGFTVVSYDKKQRPVYIKGVRGIVERNAMRYYLAVKTHLATQSLPASDRFEKRITLWFDEIMHYPRQLGDLKKKDYLASKRKEHKHSIKLQQQTQKP